MAYWLQLIDDDGHIIARMRPTKRIYGTTEPPLIGPCCEEIIGRIGWWRSKRRIRAAVEEGLFAAIQLLKDQSRLHPT